MTTPKDEDSQPPETAATARSGVPPPYPSQVPPEEAAVGELVSALNRRRLYREVTLALRSGLRDATADFSFLRTKGLRGLLGFLRNVAASDDSIRLFRHSQTIPELQVVPVLFQHALQQSKDNPSVSLEHILGTEPLKIVGPATNSEIALALRVLEGCCLLHSGSATLAHKHKAIKDFGECHAIEKIIELIQDEQGDENIRLKCGEFLLLLIGHVNRIENSPLVNIYEELQQTLGEKCASLIWAAGQFGSTLGPEERQTALQIQARRVIESLDIN